MKPNITKYVKIAMMIREQDPLKQGLKLFRLSLEACAFGIREQDPLKQGLKQNKTPSSRKTLLNSRARSTKTRIETLRKFLLTTFQHQNSRARSTKTRIETQLHTSDSKYKRIIREQDPLKQGLKLPTVVAFVIELFIREQDPLKQGLKPQVEKCLANSKHIREQDPLKQGLKLLRLIEFHHSASFIREQDPLKQGLKRTYYIGAWL